MAARNHLTLVLPGALVVALCPVQPARADCVTAGGVTTCTSAAPNPHPTRVGTGRLDNNRTVVVQPGAEIAVVGQNAISIGDNALITLQAGSTVTNTANGGTGAFGTGNNTIEFNSNGTLTIEAGARLVMQGTQANAEAINVHGFGNTIINRGLIETSGASAAIWFEDQVSGAKNTVDNFGIIRRPGGGNVIGTSGGSGIIFRNRSDAQVIGSLIFANGNDDLFFYARSLVTGDINGGGGVNNLTLEGAAGSQDTLAGAIRNFTTLTKDGQGQWTVSGSLEGFTVVTVRNGTLTLTGDNTGYTGSAVVDPTGILEARAQSLPTKLVPGDNVNNVENNGLLRFTQPDTGTYIGQITGTGVVEKTGAGTVTLSPIAAAGNTYAGGTVIREGILSTGADNALGAPAGGLTLDGGSFRFDTSFSLGTARAIAVTANNGGIVTPGGIVATIAQGIGGAGQLTKAGEGLLIMNGISGYAGGTVVAEGTLAVGDAASPAAALAGGGPVQVAAGATLGGYGRVTGPVVNAGTLAVADALAPFNGGPKGNFTIDGTLTHAGLARIGGAGVGNALVVRSYVGQNGVLGINTVLAGDGSPSDRLIVAGGTATGNSILDVTNVGGLGDRTPGNGILVVSATNGATTAPGAFRLAGPLLAGPYEYTLFRGSRDASDPQSLYLRSELILTPTPGPGPGPGPGPNPPGPNPAPVTVPGQPALPNYRREVSLYTALPSMLLNYGRTVLGTLHERVGDEELLRGRADLNGSPYLNGAWGRVIAQRNNVDAPVGGIYNKGPSFDDRFTAFQLGLDLYRKEHADGSRDHAGLYVAFGHGEGDAKHVDRTRAGTSRYDASTVGAYWTRFGPSGWYLDAVTQGTWYNAKSNSGRLAGLKPDGFGFAASLEGGYPWQIGAGWVLEPQAQLVYQTLSMDGGNDGAGYVRFREVESLAGRVGLRLSKTWSYGEGADTKLVGVWMRANLWNEFLGAPKTEFLSASGFVPFRSDLGGAWADLGVGVTAQLTRTTSLYANAGYQIGLNGRRDGYDGKVGLRVNW